MKKKYFADFLKKPPIENLIFTFSSIPRHVTLRLCNPLKWVFSKTWNFFSLPVWKIVVTEAYKIIIIKDSHYLNLKDFWITYLCSSSTSCLWCTLASQKSTAQAKLQSHEIWINYYYFILLTPINFSQCFLIICMSLWYLKLWSQ